jgi:hypothetical protein
MKNSSLRVRFCRRAGNMGRDRNQADRRKSLSGVDRGTEWNGSSAEAAKANPEKQAERGHHRLASRKSKREYAEQKIGPVAKNRARRRTLPVHTSCKTQIWRIHEGKNEQDMKKSKNQFFYWNQTRFTRQTEVTPSLPPSLIWLLEMKIEFLTYKS